MIVTDQIRQANPFFRVLALSATPGDDPVKAQAVVSNLLISHIEMRNEEALDVRQYVHTRRMDVIVVKLSPLYRRLRTDIDTLIDSTAGRLAARSGGALRVTNAKSLTHFVVMKARQEYVASQGNRSKDEYAQLLSNFSSFHLCVSSHKLVSSISDLICVMNIIVTLRRANETLIYLTS